MDCGQVQVLLNKEQAQEFAKAIFADIADYVENHREEYEQFLAENHILKEE